MLLIFIGDAFGRSCGETGRKYYLHDITVSKSTKLSYSSVPSTSRLSSHVCTTTVEPESITEVDQCCLGDHEHRPLSVIHRLYKRASECYYRTFGRAGLCLAHSFSYFTDDDIDGVLYGVGSSNEPRDRQRHSVLFGAAHRQPTAAGRQSIDVVVCPSVPSGSCK
jgi:hypothetical protein